MRDAFVASLLSLAQANRQVVLITGDLGFGVLDKFQKALPAQYINAGVAEQNMTGLAAGMALEGKIVFTYSIGNFPTLRCLEQIRLDVLYHGANVNIVAVGGGFSYGSLGVSHHATEDIAIMRALPGIRVYAPCDEMETRSITEEMVTHPGPSYLRLDKSKLVAHETAAYQRGKLRVIRPGKDVLIFGYGGILAEALAASDQLATFGIECGVISVSSLKPFDSDSFTSLSSTVDAIVTLEEHVSIGGLSSIVADVLIEADHRPRRLLRLSLADQFTAIVGSQEYLRARCGLDASAITKRIRELLCLS